MSLYTKTIAPCDGGINHAKKPYVIDPSQWVTLAQLRCKEGIVQNFPGWATALAAGTVGAYGTFATEFATTDGNVRYIVGGPSNLYRVDLLAGALVCSLTTCRDLSGESPDDWRFPVHQSSLTLSHVSRGTGPKARVTKSSEGNGSLWLPAS